MRPLAHRIVLAAIITASVLVPATASAVTLDQIVALARAGVTDAVILALIDRDKTIFSIEPEQLVSLKSAGVSEPVILAMLKSGREEGDRYGLGAAKAERLEREPDPYIQEGGGDCFPPRRSACPQSPRYEHDHQAGD